MCSSDDGELIQLYIFLKFRSQGSEISDMQSMLSCVVTETFIHVHPSCVGAVTGLTVTISTPMTVHLTVNKDPSYSTTRCPLMSLYADDCLSYFN